MPRIFDNIEQSLLPALQETLQPTQIIKDFEKAGVLKEITGLNYDIKYRMGRESEED
jgi:hypothetical protein